MLFWGSLALPSLVLNQEKWSRSAKASWNIISGVLAGRIGFIFVAADLMGYALCPLFMAVRLYILAIFGNGYCHLGAQNCHLAGRLGALQGLLCPGLDVFARFGLPLWWHICALDKNMCFFVLVPMSFLNRFFGLDLDVRAPKTRIWCEKNCNKNHSSRNLNDFNVMFWFCVAWRTVWLFIRVNQAWNFTIFNGCPAADPAARPPEANVLVFGPRV